MPGVAAIVLAAGRAQRFGAGEGDSKVVAAFEGQPLVRRIAMTAQASRASRVVVVTGHAANVVVVALDGISVDIVYNPNYVRGMAGSLQAGLAAIPQDASGALILLADMPLVTTGTLDRLISCLEGNAGDVEAVVPTFEGRPGNPVLIGRAMFAALGRLRGDEGARKLLAMPGRVVVQCPVDDCGVEIDVDTRDALDALRSGV